MPKQEANLIWKELNQQINKSLKIKIHLIGRLAVFVEMQMFWGVMKASEVAPESGMGYTPKYCHRQSLLMYRDTYSAHFVS